MEKTAEVKERAKAQFTKMLQDKIAWITKTCWPSSMEHALRKLSQIIDAGNKLGVTVAKPFSEEQIKNLAETITPYRILEMNEDIHGILIQALTDRGVHHEFFAK